MRIISISDTHGMHNELSLPKGDVLICCGDMLGRGTLYELVNFNHWLGKQRFQHKIIIAGNHDWCFEDNKEAAIGALTNAVYLEDSSITIDGVKFYGAPWQPEFHKWVFNLPRGLALKAKWDLIPNDTDVLITHGPPLGILDEVKHRHVGCEKLLQAVALVQPKLHVFGHIHEGYGELDDGRTVFQNASICDAKYKPNNKPLFFDN